MQLFFSKQKGKITVRVIYTFFLDYVLPYTLSKSAKISSTSKYSKQRPEFLLLDGPARADLENILRRANTRKKQITHLQFFFFFFFKL